MLTRLTICSLCISNICNLVISCFNFEGGIWVLIIPPVYEVYRGYIVFAFSVCECVCVCVNFFLSKISQQLLDPGF